MGGAIGLGLFVGFRFLRNADPDAIGTFDPFRVYNRGGGSDMMRSGFLLRAFGGGGAVATGRPAFVSRWRGPFVALRLFTVWMLLVAWQAFTSRRTFTAWRSITVLRSITAGMEFTTWRSIAARLEFAAWGMFMVSTSIAVGAGAFKASGSGS